MRPLLGWADVPVGKFIERVPNRHRYRVTDFGFRAACSSPAPTTRVLRPELSAIHDPFPPASTRLRNAVDKVDNAGARLWKSDRLAA